MLAIDFIHWLNKIDYSQSENEHFNDASESIGKIE